MYKFASICLITFLVGCSPTILIDPFFSQFYSKPTRIDYEVWGTLIQKISEDHYKSDTALFLVYEKTKSFTEWKPISKRVGLLEKETGKKLSYAIKHDFEIKNRISNRILINNFHKAMHCRYFKKEEIDSVQSCEKRWLILREIYPNLAGIFELSRIGFNKDETKALVYISSRYNCLKGIGHFVLLSKIGNKWEITSKKIIWIS